MFRRIVGIILSFMLLGLLAATAYAAGWVPGDVYQAMPAADHCAGISTDAAGSAALAANPELSTACRFAGSDLAKNEGSQLVDPYQRTADELARQQNFIRQAELQQAAIDTANPEIMKARRYTTAESGVSSQSMDAIQRYGLAESLVAEKDVASAQVLEIDDIYHLDLNKFMEAVEK